ncbi:hypothetical protein BDR05DRAFT_945760 [Suillus weaverae]|nr:hypothetical protein BDR05DRAFT_945760 [Suillus weaverae]
MSLAIIYKYSGKICSIWCIIAMLHDTYKPTAQGGADLYNSDAVPVLRDMGILRAIFNAGVGILRVMSDLLLFRDCLVPKLKKNKTEALYNIQSFRQVKMCTRNALAAKDVIPLPSASDCNTSCSVEDVGIASSICGSRVNAKVFYGSNRRLAETVSKLRLLECRNNPQSMEKVPRVHWALLQLSHGALAVPNHIDPSADGGYDTLVASNKVNTRRQREHVQEKPQWLGD